jgi:hypothetical protein
MRNLLLVLSLLTVFTLQLKADGDDLFNINEDQIMTEMADLTALENFVTENQGVTLDEMKANNHPLSIRISSSNIGLNSLSGILSPMSSIPAFLWGFCLGPIGVVIVFIIDEDDVLMSVVGCLVSSVLYGGGWLLVN